MSHHADNISRRQATPIGRCLGLLALWALVLLGGAPAVAADVDPCVDSAAPHSDGALVQMSGEGAEGPEDVKALCSDAPRYGEAPVTLVLIGPGDCYAANPYRTFNPRAPPSSR